MGPRRVAEGRLRGRWPPVRSSPCNRLVHDQEPSTQKVWEPDFATGSQPPRRFWSGTAGCRPGSGRRRCLEHDPAAADWGPRSPIFAGSRSAASPARRSVWPAGSKLTTDEYVKAGGMLSGPLGQYLLIPEIGQPGDQLGCG